MSESPFDPRRSAQLHNEIMRHAWTGAGRDSASLPSTTWWEISSPVPAKIATTLNGNLICFLRLAKSTTWDPEFHFFYFLHSLQGSDYLHWLSMSERYIYLYSPTSAYGDEEVGIVFDQETELAAYVAHHYDLIDVLDEPWAWKPLQDILQAYLEMIEEGKVQASPDSAEEQEAWPNIPRFFPWQYHQYTARDVEKTNKAFTRLLDAIEHRLPQPTRDPALHLPYSPAILDEAKIPDNSFIRPFFSEMPPRTLTFHYIAPGISIQSPTQFAAQPWKEISSKDRVGHTVPVLLFRGDKSSSLNYKRLFFPDPEDSEQGTSTGLYILAPGIGAEQFGNSCRLLLPFDIGGRGHARFSNGQQLQQAFDETSDELYQPGRESGFLEFHLVQLHKVLLNWAERVEAGDWEVDADGVVGGIGKFQEADTPEHWKKYQIPLSW